MFHLFKQYALVTIGALIGALSIVVFLAPAETVPGGVTGISVLINSWLDIPISILIFGFNIPILYLGYRMLPGGWQATAGTLYVIVIYTMIIGAFEIWFSDYVPASDRLLLAIFGGVAGGLSTGLVFRAGFSFGGTSTIALIVQRYTGTSMSTTFLYTDTLIIISAGLLFGLEGALYALIVLFISGIATDYVMEGPSVIRTVMIITDKPDEVGHGIMTQLARGVTQLSARGMYSGHEHSMLYVTVARPQANDLLRIVSDIDEHAFIVIGHGHTAYGSGFQRLIKNRNGIAPKPQGTAT